MAILDDAQCLKCGYLLRGLSRNTCPECGSAFNPDDPETYRVPGRRVKRGALVGCVPAAVAGIGCGVSLVWVWWYVYPLLAWRLKEWDVEAFAGTPTMFLVGVCFGVGVLATWGRKWRGGPETTRLTCAVLILAEAVAVTGIVVILGRNGELGCCTIPFIIPLTIFIIYWVMGHS
jgi:hypothetical protein